MSEHPYREFVESLNKREQELTAELSRLRDLVREMREASGGFVVAIQAYVGAQHNEEYMKEMIFAGLRYDTAIAKADAILKESGHE